MRLCTIFPKVSAIIANLRNVANDMGNTIRAQNAALDRIDAKQNSDIARVGMAVQKAGELMKWTLYYYWNICNNTFFNIHFYSSINSFLKVLRQNKSSKRRLLWRSFPLKNAANFLGTQFEMIFCQNHQNPSIKQVQVWKYIENDQEMKIYCC